MEAARFAEIASTYRHLLVHLTMARGHDYEMADDIVQTSTINAMSVAHRCRTAADVRRLLKTCTFRDSANQHRDQTVSNKYMSRLDDIPEQDQEGEAFAYNPEDANDLRLDIKRALHDLSPDDREIVRLLYIEGWTYAEVHTLFGDLFTSKTHLFEYVHANLRPRLANVLEAYRKPDPAPYRPLRISQPTYIVYEQVFHDQGYDLVPVTGRVTFHHDARVDIDVLEKRYREGELECRQDWSRRESTEPITSPLQHIGNRNKTRFFTVRRKEDI